MPTNKFTVTFTISNDSVESDGGKSAITEIQIEVHTDTARDALNLAHARIDNLGFEVKSFNVYAWRR